MKTTHRRLAGIVLKTQSVFAAVLIALVALLHAPAARAGDGTWNVNAASTWSTAGNWTSNPNPAPGVNDGSTTNQDTATFGNAILTARTVTVDANRNVKNITFDNVAFTYTLSSGSLLLSNGGAITVNNTVSVRQNISSPITLQGDGGSYSFISNDTNVADGLLISGTVAGVSTGTNVTTLTLDGSSTATSTSSGNVLSGVISDGIGGGKLALVKSGAGTWTLTNTNTFTGGITINNGNLIVTTSGAVGTGSAVKFGTSDGTFTMQNNSGTTFTAGLNTGTSGGTIVINRSSGGAGITHTFSGSNTLGSNTVVVNSGSFVTSGNFGLTFTGLTSFAAANTNAVFTLNGPTGFTGNSTLTFSGGFNLGGSRQTLTINSGTGTGINSGSITGAFSGTPGTLVFAGSAPVTITSLTGATADAVEFNSTTGGVYTLSTGSSTFTGGVKLTSGTLVISSNGTAGTSGPLGNGGTFTIAGGTIDTNGSARSLSNVNPISITGDFSYSTAAGTASNNITLPGKVTLSGNRVITLNGGGTLSFTGGIASDGTLHTLTFNTGNVGGTASAVLSGPFSGTAGTLVLAGSGPVTVSSLTGATADAVQVNGAGVYTFSGSSTFTGGVTLTAGTLNLNASGNVGVSGPLGNGGTFTIAGGTIDNTSGALKALTNVNPLNITGDFAYSTAAGTANNSLTLPGKVILTGNRTITLNGAGVLSLTGGFAADGTSHTLTFNTSNGSSATALISGAFSGTPGTLVLAGNTPLTVGSLTGATADALQINGSGAYTFSGSSTFTGGVTLNNSAASYVVTGGGGVGSGGKVKFNTSGITLDLRSAATTFTAGLDTSAAGATISVGPAIAGAGLTHILSGASALGTNTVVINPGPLTTVDTAYGLTLSGTTGFSAAGRNATFTINGNGTGNATLTLSGGFDAAGSTQTLTFNSGTGTGVNSVVLQGAFSGTAGTVVLAGNAPVTINNLTGATADAIAINSTTGGVYTSSGAGTFTGGVTLTSGTLNINSVGTGSSGPLGNGGAFVINGGTIDNTSGSSKTVANTNPITLNGNFNFSTAGSTANNNLLLPGAVTVTGNRQITLNGAAQLTLGGLNDGGSARTLTMTGGGTLTLATAATSFDNSTVAIKAGNLRMSNTALGLGAIILGDNTAGQNATVTFISNQVTYNNNPIFVADGLGTRTISNTSNGTGSSALVVPGTVTLAHDVTFLSTGTHSNGTKSYTGGVLGTGNITIDITGRELQFTGTWDVAGSITKDNVGNAVINSSLNDKITGVTVNNGYLSVGGTNNTYTGAYTVTGGALAPFTSTAFNSALNVLNVGAAGKLDLLSPVGSSTTHFNVTFAGVSDISGAGGTLTNASSGTNTLTVAGSDSYSFSGIMTASSFALTRAGTGTQTFTNGGSTNSGTTTITTGTLIGAAASGTPFGTGNVALNAGTLSIAPTGSGTNIDIAGGDVAAARTFTYGRGGFFKLDRGSQSSLTYTFSGSGSPFVRATDGTLILNVSDITKLGAPVANNGERFLISGTAPSTVNGVIAGAVVQDRTTSEGDFLVYDATNGFKRATPTSTNTFANNNADVVTISTATSTGTTAVGALKVDGVTLTNTGTMTFGASATASVGIILNGGKISGGTLTTVSTTPYSIYVSSAGGEISSTINTGNTNGMNVFGPGALTLSNAGSNSFAGGLRINNSKVIATSNAQLGNTQSAIQLLGGTFSASGTFNFGSGSTTNRQIVLAAGQTATGGTIEVTGANSVITHANASGKTVNGTGSLTKTGAGTLVLDGSIANTYSGGTIVAAGTLEAAKNLQLLGTGNVSVTGGTLKLTDATAAPVVDIILDTASLNIASGGSINLNFNGVETVGSLTLNGVSYAPLTTFDNNNNWGGFGNTSGFFAGSTGALAVVPEPGTLSLIGVAMLGLLKRRRTR